MLSPFEACAYFSQELLAVEPSVFMKQPINKAGTVDSAMLELLKLKT